MKKLFNKLIPYILFLLLATGGTVFSATTDGNWFKNAADSLATNTGNGLANADIHVRNCYIGLGTGTPCGGGGGGSVTSVGLALPTDVFNISGSPVTTSGTLTGTFDDQAGHTFFAGPDGGGPDTPTFRAIELDDLPTSEFTVPLSQITDALANHSISNGNFAQSWAWDSLVNNVALSLSSSNTGSTTSAQKILSISLSGANANAAQTTTSAYVENTHTGTTSTNYALSVFTNGASTANYGAAIGVSGTATTNIGLNVAAVGGTNNYAIIVPGTGGSVGIGTSTPTSLLDVTTNTLGVTQTNTSGLALVNTTAAVNGTQQISPAIRWRGNGYHTATNPVPGSQVVDFRAYVLPVQGSSIVNGIWKLEASTNGAGYNERFGVGDLGQIRIGGSAGSSGEVLTSSGAGAPPTWTAPTGLANGSGTTAAGNSVDIRGLLTTDADVSGDGAGDFIFHATATGLKTVFETGLTILGDVIPASNSTTLTIDNDNEEAYFQTIHNDVFKLGVANADPKTTLDNSGSFSSAIRRDGSSSYTFDNQGPDFTVSVDNAGSAVDVILPDPALFPGRIVVVKRSDASSTGDITITSGGSADVQNPADGTLGSSLVLSGGGWVKGAIKMWQSDGARWQSIGSVFE